MLCSILRSKSSMNESSLSPILSDFTVRDDTAFGLVRDGLGFFWVLGGSLLLLVVLPSSACLNFSSAVFSLIILLPVLVLHTALTPNYKSSHP